MMKTAILILLASLVFPLCGDNTIAYAAPDRWYDGFVTSYDATRIPEKTRFQITWDKQNLYIELDMGGSDLKRNTNFQIRKGAWPYKESVEIFLDPAGSRKSYFQLAAGKEGIRYDSRAKKNPKLWETLKWEAVNLTDDDGHWKLRFILPFSDPGMKQPSIGDVWYFNVCRNVDHGTKFRTVPATWVNAGRHFHNPSKFAILAFGTPEEFHAVRNRQLKKKMDAIVARAQKSPIDSAYQNRISRAEKELSDQRITNLQDELEIIEAIHSVK